MADSTAHIAQLYKYPPLQSPRYGVFRTIIVPVEMDLGATAATYFTFTPLANLTIVGLQFAVTSEAVVGTTTAPVVSISVATVEKATLTVPDTTAIGATVSSDLIEVNCSASQALACKVKTTAVGGTVAGKGFMILTVVDDVA